MFIYLTDVLVKSLMYRGLCTAHPILYPYKQKTHEREHVSSQMYEHCWYKTLIKEAEPSHEISPSNRKMINWNGGRQDMIDASRNLTAYLSDMISHK